MTQALGVAFVPESFNALTSVKALKAALLKEYPAKDKQINEALTVWANYEKRKP